MDIIKRALQFLFRKNENITITTGSSINKTAVIKTTKGGNIIAGKVIINGNSFVCASGGEIVLSNNVSINRNSVLVAKEKIYVGEGTSIGPNVCIYDHDHKFDKDGFYKDQFRVQGVHIGKNTWIAANCTILKGTTIGDNCVVGAGCIISGCIPSNSLVKGGRDIEIIELR